MSASLFTLGLVDLPTPCNGGSSSNGNSSGDTGSIFDQAGSAASDTASSITDTITNALPDSDTFTTWLILIVILAVLALLFLGKIEAL